MNQQTVQPLSPVVNLVFLFFMLASVWILVCSVRYLLQKIQSHSSNDAGRSFRIFTLFVLAATAVMFVPVYYLSYSFEDPWTLFRPLLLSIHNAMRVFILDGEFDFLTKSIQGLNGLLHVLFSLYAALLYVAAPVIFTFTIFLSIFRDSFAEIQLKTHRKEPLYVFSCLNEESAAMAMSILPQNTEGESNQDTRCMIVFCNVPQDEENREAQVSLIPKTSAKHVYILFTRKSVEELDTSRFEKEISFFLMDREEEKNLQDADALSKRLKKESDDAKPNESVQKPAVRIYVYAPSPASIPLIDAMSRKVSVPENTVMQLKRIIDNVRRTENGPEYRQRRIIKNVGDSICETTLSFSEPFSIMRIDIKTQMAMRIIREFQKTDAFITAMEEKKGLTVTLLGLGGIGKEILENLLWMCQEYRHTLTINVFDSTGPELGEDPDSARNPLYDRLAYEWPELMKTNRDWQKDPGTRPDTDSSYDIRFFLGLNCFSNRFRRLFEEKSGDRDRLLQSDIVICSLGDDDRNMEAAMIMRQLFTGYAVEHRRDPSDEQLYEQPVIYAIVYDNQRADCFSSQEEITNYKENPFNIETMGSMKTQYSYESIQDLAKLEKAAIIHHISWIVTMDEQKCSAQGKDDSNEELRNMLNDYIHYEYFRQSSLAKAIHRNALEKRQAEQPAEAANENTQAHDDSNPGCRCALCVCRISEHMRWNAYMRVNGYRYGRTRNDMAKIHTCLLPWSELPPGERIKD